MEFVLLIVRVMHADYLRYCGLQEFDRAMQHLEQKYEYVFFCKSLLLLIVLGMHPLGNII